MEVACALIPEPALLEQCEKEERSPDDLWEEVLRGLEETGAAVESERLGEAFFAVDGLRGIHGGDTAGVVAAARERAAPAKRNAPPGEAAAPFHLATAPTRFAAFAAASRDPRAATAGREPDVSRHALRRFLSALPVSTLVSRLGLPERQAADLTATLERLGIAKLGPLAALSPGRVADRFGPPGLRAFRLARGDDEPLRPREPHEELVEEIELPEGTAGCQLDRALELLIDRLLAAPQRRDRTLLGLRLGAMLSSGGRWSVDQGLGRPTASAAALRSVLATRLEALPAPATSLWLRAVGLGPRAADQLQLSIRGDEPRRRRLGAAVREVRAAQGAAALLKVLPVDGGSRVPERWVMLTPFPDR
jgi:protein ImuB